MHSSTTQTRATSPALTFWTRQVPLSCVYMFIWTAPAWIFFVQKFSCEISRLGLGPFFVTIKCSKKPYSVCRSLLGSPGLHRRGSQNPQKDKKLRNFMFWRAVCSPWRIGGFSWTWEVLLGGPKRYVDQKIELFSSLFFTFWSSDYPSRDSSPDFELNMYSKLWLVFILLFLIPCPVAWLPLRPTYIFTSLFLKI